MESPLSSRRSTYSIESPKRVWLHRFAMFLVGYIVLLIFIGGQVKSTGSGLAVPDWPNTYGHFMFSFPYESMVGGIFWEHLHRMVASLAGIFTFALTIWAIRVEPRGWVRRIAIAASVAVLVQGLLGGLTVLLYLPVWTSSLHGTLAQCYLCLAVTMAIVTSPRWSDAPRSIRESSSGLSIRTLVLATTATIFVQLVIGALMRHSEAGLAIPDFPTMFGSWIPPLSDARLAAANRELASLNLLAKMDTEEITRWQMISHLLHRGWALVVALMIGWTAFRAFRLRELPGDLARNVWMLVALVVVQIALGILSILTEKQFTITSLHVTTGALTLATSLALTVRIRHHVPARAVAAGDNRVGAIAQEVAA
jgi:cytochrome c oxidase assembly protein subunit 15